MHPAAQPLLLTSKRPRLGLSLPARIFSAVLLPVPLDPTRPSTWPGRGMGSLQGGGEGGGEGGGWGGSLASWRDPVRPSWRLPCQRQGSPKVWPGGQGAMGAAAPDRSSFGAAALGRLA